MAGEISFQSSTIGVSARTIAESVDLQHRIPCYSKSGQDVPAAGDYLGIRQGFGWSDQLGADLMKLAVATLLRALVAEHRPGVEHLLGQRLSEPVAHQGTTDARRALWPQRDAFAAPVLKAVHLLGHHIPTYRLGCGRIRGCPRRSVWTTRRSRTPPLWPGRFPPLGYGAVGLRRSGRGCRGVAVARSCWSGCCNSGRLSSPVAGPGASACVRSG